MKQTIGAAILLVLVICAVTLNSVFITGLCGDIQKSLEDITRSVEAEQWAAAAKTATEALHRWDEKYERLHWSVRDTDMMTITESLVSLRADILSKNAWQALGTADLVTVQLSALRDSAIPWGQRFSLRSLLSSSINVLISVNWR